MQLAAFAFERHGPVVVASVTGEIDMSNATDLRSRVMEALTNEDTALVLDLTPTTFVDSAGLHVIFELQAVLQEHRQGFHLVVPPGSQPWRTLDIVGMERVTQTHEDRASALTAAAPEPPPT